jgi:tetratricopeptide (TPR) repeat protein
MTTSSTVNSALEVARSLDDEFAEHPNNPLPLAWSGQMYMVLGENVDQKYFAEAERALLAAHQLSPKKQEFLFYLGRLYLLKKDFPSAIRYQEQAIAAAPNISTGHWFLGLTYIASGNSKEGLKKIEEAIRLGYSLTLENKLYIIDLYAGQKQYDKVLERYQALVKEEPENVNWYIKLAATYVAMGNKSKALEMVKKAVALYPPLAPEADKFIKENKL